MKKIIPFFFTLCFVAFGAQFLMAQTPTDVNPCGTAGGRSPWLIDYQQRPEAFAPLLETRGVSTLYLPLTLQIVRNDDSTAGANLEAVFASFCQLNKDYEPVGIQFFIEPPIRYINDSDFYIHDSVRQGGLKMLQYNVANTINVYFVGSPAGNCGYNLPYAGIAMNNGCLSGHTFAHEMGHNLSLPHTFYGWEGGTGWNGSPVQVFTGPAPAQVTVNYTDFKDTLYTDTLIIDTVYVEKVARSGASANCSVAADGFCDTPADYLAYRWQCGATGMSSVQQYDPDNVAFYSDGWYVMSYSYDNCQVGFSQGQINAMQAYVLSERQNMLYNQSPMRDSVPQTTLESPALNAIIADHNPRFDWSAVPNATHYLLEIYKEPYATNQVVERVLLSDTFYQSTRTYSPRPASFPYAWKVFPFNYGYTCAGFTFGQQFNTMFTSGTTAIDTESDLAWELLPNFTNAGSSVQLTIASTKNMEAALRIYTATGQLLWSATQQLESNTQRLDINIPSHWAAGLYFVELSSPNGYRAVKKMVITNN